MNPAIQSENRYTIVYDADLIPEPKLCLFDPLYWRENQSVTGQATGRGSVLFLQTDFGPAALRAYLRGGVPARFSKDLYIFKGVEQSRPFREFRLLEQLTLLGLPVPAPVAACIVRSGLSYRGFILMRKIEATRPLSEALKTEDQNSPMWAAIGKCIRRFHQAGVNHADLNADNLLIDFSGKNIHIIDFDRCTITHGKVISGKSNLARLKRSLIRLWPADDQYLLEACWKRLIEGYDD